MSTAKTEATTVPARIHLATYRTVQAPLSLVASAGQASCRAGGHAAPKGGDE